MLADEISSKKHNKNFKMLKDAEINSFMFVLMTLFASLPQEIHVNHVIIPVLNTTNSLFLCIATKHLE